MESNKEYFREKQHEYYTANKDIISVKSKKYREEHLEQKKKSLRHIIKQTMKKLRINIKHIGKRMDIK